MTIERISPKGDSTLNGQPLACDTPITVKDGDCLNLAHNTDIMTFRIAEPIESSSISESNPKTEPKKLYRQDFSDESDFLDDFQWIKKGPETAGLPPSASPQPVFTKETVKRQKKAVVKKEPVVKRTAAVSIYSNGSITRSDLSKKSAAPF